MPLGIHCLEAPTRLSPMLTGAASTASRIDSSIPRHLFVANLSRVSVNDGSRLRGLSRLNSERDSMTAACPLAVAELTPIEPSCLRTS
jgi:hypothetical protein